MSLAAIEPAAAQQSEISQAEAAYGDRGYGYVWKGNQGIWVQPNGRAMWIDRLDSGLGARYYFDVYQVQAGRICMQATHRVQGNTPHVVCVTPASGKCRITQTQGNQLNRSRRCQLTTQKPNAWANLSYERRPSPNAHCCGYTPRS